MNTALCEQSAFECSKIFPYNFKLGNNFAFTCNIVYKAYLPMPIIIVLYIALLFQLLIVVDFIGECSLFLTKRHWYPQFIQLSTQWTCIQTIKSKYLNIH